MQLSARLAVEGAARAGSLRALCYGRDCRLPEGSESSAIVRACSHSKAGAAFDALRNRNGADCVLYWHSDLLKLMRFAGPGRRNLLFLHGIECWRKMEGAVARAMDNVDIFLSNSEFTWNRFTELNPRWKTAKHETVALGAGVPEPEPPAPSATPAALMLGRMSRGEGYKGHEEVIRAWPRVTAERPDAELWIVGGGDGVDDFRRIAAALPCSHQIRFFGLVPNEEKERLLREARCLVLPSRGEGFGLVYLEAMRLGRPCLASDCDAGREVVGAPECGMTANPANPDEVAAAIVRLLGEQAAWERMSVNARRRYEERFTAAHFQQRLIKALERAAA